MVFRAGEKSEKITEITEQAVTNVLIRLSKGVTKIIRFVQGHGERALPVGADPTALMSRRGYDVIVKLLEADVTDTPDGGAPVTMGKGDLVTFPAGMSCTWEIRRGVRKHYTFEQGSLFTAYDSFVNGVPGAI